MPLYKLPLIMAFMSKKMMFSYMKLKKNLPLSSRSVASLPRFGLPLTNTGCTTVTGIAIRAQAPMPPPPPLVDSNFVKDIFFKGGVDDWYMPPRINYPIIMAFHVQENAVFIHKFSKISLPWEGEIPLPYPPPPPPPR